MSYTWGGDPFPVNPDAEGGIDISVIEYGSAIRTANLTLRQDVIGTKRRIKLTFGNLTLTQLADLADMYDERKTDDAVSGGTMVLGDASRTYTVKTALDGWKETPIVDGGAGGYHYGCTITVDEV